ncbi:MAG TPA: MlaA family lipoprotein, partial [Gemmatimonadales bacterium]
VMGEVNQALLTWVARPLSAGWRAITAKGVRDACARFGTNLAWPVRVVNQALQGDWSDAGTETARFAINTTVGLLGFFDPAAGWWSIAAPDAADTGQTLGRWGWDARAFVMLPVIGPSSERDAAGWVVDMFLNPAAWIGYGLRGCRKTPSALQHRTLRPMHLMVRCRRSAAEGRRDGWDVVRRCRAFAGSPGGIEA